MLNSITGIVISLITVPVMVISTDVVDTLTNTSNQGITLTVVGAVMVFDVGVSSLQIA